MSYTDLTNSFAYKDLFSWSKLDQLAANDAYDTFRSGTKTVFYQSSLPAGWTKQTGFNDAALRIVTGSTGGTLTAGTQGLSATVSLAHTHTSATHSHSGNSHLHTMILTVTAASFSANGNKPVIQTAGTLGVMQADAIGTTRPSVIQNQTLVVAQTTSSDNVGTTNSQLSDVAFAYCDVIIASKDV